MYIYIHTYKSLTQLGIDAQLTLVLHYTKHRIVIIKLFQIGKYNNFFPENTDLKVIAIFVKRFGFLVIVPVPNLISDLSRVFSKDLTYV